MIEPKIESPANRVRNFSRWVFLPGTRMQNPAIIRTFPEDVRLFPTDSSMLPVRGRIYSACHITFAARGERLPEAWRKFPAPLDKIATLEMTFPEAEKTYPLPEKTIPLLEIISPFKESFLPELEVKVSAGEEILNAYEETFPIAEKGYSDFNRIPERSPPINQNTHFEKYIIN